MGEQPQRHTARRGGSDHMQLAQDPDPPRHGLGFRVQALGFGEKGFSVAWVHDIEGLGLWACSVQ